MAAQDQRLIICIEDIPAMVELLRRILSSERLVVRTALNGRQGLAMIRQLQPDLVLLDLMLPDINGWDVLREMQEDPATCEIPVIVVTARAGLLMRDTHAQQLDCLAGYFVKPFSVHELRRAVDHALDAT
jgi:CheY-like chemotaxis protein